MRAQQAHFFHLTSCKMVAVLALLLLTSSSPLRAQSESQGYLVIAPAVVSGGGESHSALQGVVGGEGVFPGGVGLGAEIGALGVRAGSDSLASLLSLNGYFHVPRSFSTVDPFLTAGYTALFDFFNNTSFSNLGVGMNWWFASRVGLKLEFRDHFRTGNESANVATFRFGLAFH